MTCVSSRSWSDGDSLLNDAPSTDRATAGPPTTADADDPAPTPGHRRRHATTWQWGGTTPSRTHGGRPCATTTDTPMVPNHSMTACGLGDIVVRGRYYLLDERGWVPTIALRAHVKAPTADAERAWAPAGRTKVLA